MDIFLCNTWQNPDHVYLSISSIFSGKKDQTFSILFHPIRRKLSESIVSLKDTRKVCSCILPDTFMGQSQICNKSKNTVYRR